MLSLSQIESDLTESLKARDSLRVDTLRGLKTRIQNELTKAASAGKKELGEPEILALVKSEIKKRKDAAEAFLSGGRSDSAKKEQDEAGILQKYLPLQMSESDLAVIVEKTIAEMSATAVDFGKVMGKLKAQVGDSADGAMLAKLLKEKLK